MKLCHCVQAHSKFQSIQYILLIIELLDATLAKSNQITFEMFFISKTKS